VHIRTASLGIGRNNVTEETSASGNRGEHYVEYRNKISPKNFLKEMLTIEIACLRRLY